MLYISVTFISEENQIGIIVDLLLKLGRGNNWSNRTTPLGGKDEETEVYRNQLLWGTGVQEGH